jgi:hypothetical protein
MIYTALYFKGQQLDQDQVVFAGLSLGKDGFK